jgi:purine catabolism regulator
MTVALTVEQLVHRPELATRVIAGADGVPRTIGWAHACEMPDPWRWIGDGDLLMTTGLGVPASESDQVEYVERVAAVGAAGIAVGEDMEAPPLQQGMLDTADRCGLPLLLTRYEIPFISLARAVIEANIEEHLARIRQTERVYEVLRRSSTQDLDLVGLLCSLEEVVGCELGVVDPSSARGLVRVDRLPADVAAAVRDWSPDESDEGPVVFSASGVPAIGVVVPSPRPTVLVAWAADCPLPDSTVLRHMAAATALHQTRLYAERERSLRIGATLLSNLLDSRISAAAGRVQLAGAGLGGDGLVLAACAPAPDGPDLHLLHHRLGDAGVSHLMLHRPPLTYVLLRGDEESVAPLAEALPDGAVVGISDPMSSPGELPTAQRQARWALHRAQERRLPLLHHSDDLGDSVFLPGNRDDSLAAAARVLGGVMAYDTAHDSHLVDSLRMFLQENRSWLRASQRLRVHKQTLVYRMRRVEELSGRDLSDTADVADLWLALQAATASGLVDR